MLGSYRDPFGGTDVLLVALPIERVEPTPYQRDPSDPHVKRLMTVIEKIGRFLDPVIAVRHEDRYWTPNGNHRLQALKRLGARSVVALLVPEPRWPSRSSRSTPRRRTTCGRSRSRRFAWRASWRAPATATESEYGFEFEEATLPHARVVLRTAAAPERRRLPFRAPAHRRVPGRAARRRARGRASAGAKAAEHRRSRGRRSSIA